MRRRVSTNINVKLGDIAVHEHRAPTDESVKLLREMEDAAKKKVIASYQIDNNGYTALMQMERDDLNDTYKGRVICELNGRRINVELTMSQDKFTVEAMAEALREDLASRIASQIIAESLQEMMVKRSNF